MSKKVELKNKTANGTKPLLFDVLFDNLVKNLRKNGYTVTVSLEEKYRFARVKGKGVTAGFCEPNNGESYSYIDGKICFDNVKCFVKWSKCPYSFPIPKTEKQFEYVLSKMQYLAQPEGYKLSNEYNLKCENNYPKNIA